jgi:hypothetical protein
MALSAVYAQNLSKIIISAQKFIDNPDIFAMFLLHAEAL